MNKPRTVSVQAVESYVRLSMPLPSLEQLLFQTKVDQTGGLLSEHAFLYYAAQELSWATRGCPGLEGCLIYLWPRIRRVFREIAEDAGQAIAVFDWRYIVWSDPAQNGKLIYDVLQSAMTESLRRDETVVVVSISLAGLLHRFWRHVWPEGFEVPSAAQSSISDVPTIGDKTDAERSAKDAGG